MPSRHLRRRNPGLFAALPVAPVPPYGGLQCLRRTLSIGAFYFKVGPVRSGETIVGHVIYVDSFGNLVTDVKADSLPLGRPVLEVSGHRIEGISSSYEVGDELLAIVGSSGRLEVSAKNANAAERLGATVGTTVVVSVP